MILHYTPWHVYKCMLIKIYVRPLYISLCDFLKCLAFLPPVGNIEGLWSICDWIECWKLWPTSSGRGSATCWSFLGSFSSQLQSTTHYKMHMWHSKYWNVINTLAPGLPQEWCTEALPQGCTNTAIYAKLLQLISTAPETSSISYLFHFWLLRVWINSLWIRVSAV